MTADDSVTDVHAHILLPRCTPRSSAARPMACARPPHSS